MRALLRSFGTLVLVLAVYYAAPIGEAPSARRLAIGLVIVLAGLCALAWLIVVQIRRQLRARDVDVRVYGLLVLLYLVVVVFAAGYLLLARSAEGQFAELETKTDALYFTVSTLATVGFGDVHAVGQLARAIVIGQIVFDFVFVAALVGSVTSGMRRRAEAQRRGARPEP
jgi:voltage-gated potassium channel